MCFLESVPCSGTHHCVNKGSMYIYNLYSTNLLIYEVLKKRRLTTRTDHLQLRIVDDIKYNQGFPSAKDVFIT